jgi:hypothetical protein
MGDWFSLSLLPARIGGHNAEGFHVGISSFDEGKRWI